MIPIILFQLYAGGNSITINHGIMVNGKFLSIGFSTRSNHFDSVSATQGSFINTSSTIGRVGNTGWSTGTHVDYNIYSTTNNSNNFLYKLYGMDRVSVQDNLYYFNPGPLWDKFK